MYVGIASSHHAFPNIIPVSLRQTLEVFENRDPKELLADPQLFQDLWSDAKMMDVIGHLRASKGLDLPEDWKAVLMLEQQPLGPLMEYEICHLKCDSTGEATVEKAFGDCGKRAAGSCGAVHAKRLEGWGLSIVSYGSRGFLITLRTFSYIMFGIFEGIC